MRIGMCVGVAVVCVLSLAPVGRIGAEDLVPDQASHTEVATIGETPETAFGRLSTVCMNADGSLLAGDSKRQEIKVISIDGKVIETWKPGIPPLAIHPCPDGTVYVGGETEVAKLDRAGKVLKTVTIEEAKQKRHRVSGLAATDRDVFVAFATRGTTGSKSDIVRLTLDLENPTTIATRLRGCCRRLDMVVLDGALYVAENVRHRIVKFDRDGTILATWGKKDRKNIEGFGSCCNPMNLHPGADKVLYTSESGLGRVKRYKPDGTYLGLVGYVDVPRFNRAGGLAASCSNIALTATKDGSRLFVQDVKKNVIRVLARKEKQGGRP